MARKQCDTPPCLSSVSLVFICWLYIVITTMGTCSTWSLFEIIFTFFHQILKSPTIFLRYDGFYFFRDLKTCIMHVDFSKNKLAIDHPKRLQTHDVKVTLLTFQLTRFLYGWYLLGMELREHATRTLMQTKVTWQQHKEKRLHMSIWWKNFLMDFFCKP